MGFYETNKDLFRYTRNGKPVLFAAVNGNQICVECEFTCRYYRTVKMVWFVNISRKVCQLSPHLANHWDWLSLKRMGSNFMAQSWMTIIVWSSNWCEAESPYAGEHSLPWCHYKVVIPSQNRMYLLSRFNYFYVNSRRNVESENIRVPDGIWTHDPPWSSRMPLFDILCSILGILLHFCKGLRSNITDPISPPLFLLMQAQSR